MSSSDRPVAQPGAGNDPLRLWLAIAGLVAAGLLAYAGSTKGPFVYLDQAAIRDNPSIRHLWPISRVLNPALEPGVTVQGRPLANLSFALNYAVGGLEVAGYHWTNILIHLSAGLALFGILRRSFQEMRTPGPLLAAWLVAVLWLVHPLATESVTYLVQRAESMMGLFYLLTLYGFLRSTSASPAGGLPWLGASWLACLLGMATKEVMASAPVMVFLYDVIFVSGSWKGALSRRWCYYAALSLTWIPLALLVAGTGGNRGGTSGFSLGVSLWQYLLTQADALVRYLKLSVWPHPLTFFYEVHWYKASEVVPQGLCIVVLLCLGGWLLRHRPSWGYLVLWFFAILAPTSLVPGLSQTIAEHRMYLATIPILVGLVLGVRWLFAAAGLPGSAYSVPLLGIALAFGLLTSGRNRTYATEVGLWEDTVTKAPGNPFSQNNLGIALTEVHRRDEAIAAFQRSVALDPNYEGAHDNLGLALAEAGKPYEAVHEYMKAIALAPKLEEPRLNLGVTLMHLQQPHEAVRQFTLATELSPGDASAFNDLAGAEMQVGRVPEAIGHFSRTVALMPGNGEAWYNLGTAYARLGRWAEAVEAFRKAVRLLPGSPDARSNLGAALATTGAYPEAIEAYRQALALNPNDPDVHENLSDALQRIGKTAEAATEHARALALRPNS